MEIEDNYKYYVVQFLQPPYDDIYELVCVPDLWLRPCKQIDEETSVAYPSEELLATKEKVKKRRKLENEWKFYSAIVKYCTDTYRDALSFIGAKSTVPKKNARSKKGSKGNKITTAKIKKPCLSKRSVSSNAKVIIRHPKVAQLNDNGYASIKLFLKRPIPRDLLREELDRKKPRIIKESKSMIKVSSVNNEPMEHLREDELRSILEDSSDVESRSREITIKTSTVVSAVNNNTCSQSNTKSRVSANPANIFLQSLGLTSRENCSSAQEKARPEKVIKKKAEVLEKDKKSRSESNTENKISTVPTSSVTANEPCQVLEHSNGKNSSQVQERHVPETVNGKCNEFNEMNQSACPKNGTGNTITAQSSTRPVIQSGQSLKCPHENQSSLHYRDTLNPDPRMQERLTQSAAEVRVMNQSSWPQRNIVNTPAMQNSPNLINQPSRPLEQLHHNYLQPNVPEYFHVDRRLQEFMARGSAGASSSDKRAYPQSHTTNMTPVMLNYSNLANLSSQAPGSAQEMLYSTANAPFYYQDPSERQISIEKSTEANVHNQRARQRARSQHNPHNTPTIQNYENIMNQFSFLPAHAQGMQPVSVIRNYPHQEDSRKQKTPNSRSAEVNHTGQRVCPQNVKNNAPSTLQKSANLANHISQLSEYLEGKHHRPVHKDFLKQDLSTSTAIGTGPTGMACMANKVPHQSINQNGPSAVQSLPSRATHLYRSAECSYGNNVSPVLKHCVQNPHLQKNDVSRTTGGNPMDLMANFPVNAQNTPLNVPYLLQFANQFGQSFDGSNRAPFPPINGNNLLQDSRLQQILHNGFTDMNGTNQRAFPQSIPQNIPSVPQNSPNVAKRSCCSCKCSNEQQPSTITSDQYYQNPQVQETPVGGLAEENCMEQNGYQSNTEQRPPATESPSNTVNQSSEYSMEEQPAPMQIGSLDQVSSTEEIPVEKMDDANDTGQSTQSKIAFPSSSDAIDHKSPASRAAVEKLLVEQFTKMFRTMHLSITKNIELFDRERATLMSYNAMLKNVIEKLDRSCKLKNDHAVVSTSKDTTKKVTDKKQNERNKVEKYNLDDDDEDDYSDNDDENNGTADDSDYVDNDNCDLNSQAPPNKQRDRRRSFSLPPEYNAKNSRWTLKCPRASSGIIEIMPNTRVYIDAIRLANCKRMSRDHKTFARMLLTEIFSQNALSVCSLTGARANAFTVGDTNIRPGLDENARTVLLTYVEEYGRDRGWGPYDSQSVLNSIRSKIQEIRTKNNSKN